jgi:FtsH-binding integral membrane protein
MPDWDNLVREHMKALDLPAHLKEEVFAELCAHLEDATANAPDQQTLRQVPTHAQWHKLSLSIQRAKQQEGLMQEGLMNDRIKHFWLMATGTWLTATLSVMVLQRPDQPLQYLIEFYFPWLAALPLVCAAGAYFAQPPNVANNRTKRLWLSVTVTWLGAFLSLIVLQHIDHPSLFLRRPIPVIFSLPWLSMLVLVGATGAYLARRADAPRKTRLLVATSPALLLGIVMLLLMPWRLAYGYSWKLIFWALIFFARDVENFVVVPGLALLLGALPFLRQRSGNSFPLPDGEADFEVRDSTGSTPLPG